MLQLEDGTVVLERPDGVQVTRVECSGFYCIDVEYFQQPGTESNLNTLINLVEGQAGKPALLNVTEDFDNAYDIGSGINRTLWLDGNFFPPDYASRPWVMWTATDLRHIDGVDGPVRWNVVAR